MSRQFGRTYKPPSCQYCSQALTFDDNHISPSGKKIPLDVETHEPHKCSSPNHPYNKKQLEMSNEENNRKVFESIDRQKQTEQQQLSKESSEGLMEITKNILDEVRSITKSVDDVSQRLDVIEARLDSMAPINAGTSTTPANDDGGSSINTISEVKQPQDKFTVPTGNRGFQEIDEIHYGDDEHIYR